MARIQYTDIEKLRYWCQMVLPAVFDDSLSYYELIAKLVDKTNEIIDSENSLATFVEKNAEAIKELQDLFKKFQESGFDDYYRAQIEEWVRTHMEDIMEQAVKMVFFGLTKDGYFCAYIPDSWREIVFDTGVVYGRSDYGRLLLRMTVDAPNVIDNTYGYTLSQQPSDMDKLVTDLEVNSKRTDSVFDNMYTNLDVEVSRGGENI